MKQEFRAETTLVYRAEEPVRDDLYRRFIKRLPCVVCGGDTHHRSLRHRWSRNVDIRCRRYHDEMDKGPATSEDLTQRRTA